MQARSSTDGHLYNWLAVSADFAAAGYPGPGSAQDVAVSMRPTSGTGGGGAGDVIGLGSSVAHRLAGFANTSGKQLEQTSFLAADIILRTGAVPFQADQSMGGHKLTTLQNGGAASQDAATVAQVETLIAAAIAGAGGGGGDGFAFTFSATTADADPGAGTLRLNNATPASITQIFVDLLDTSSNDLTAWLDRLDDSIGSVKGYVRVGSKSDKTKWLLFSLTSVTSASGYRKLGVTYVAGPAIPLTTAGDCFLSFESLGIIGTIPWSTLATAVGNLTFTGFKALGFNEVDDTTSDSGTKNIDWTAGERHKVQGTGNATATFTNPAAPMGLQLTYTQDSTGGRTFDVSSLGIIWLDGVVWTPNPNPSTPSALVLDWNGTNYFGYGRAADSRIISESTTARSLALTDSGAFIENTSGTGVSYTVDPNSTTPHPIGTEVTGVASAGQATFVQGAGVSINKAASRNRKTAEAGSPWALKKTAINTWWLFGDLEIT